MSSDDEFTSAFHEMRARMAPDEALVGRLHAAIAAAPAPSRTSGRRRARLTFWAGIAAGGVIGAVVSAALVLSSVAPLPAVQRGWLPVTVSATPAEPGSPSASPARQPLVKDPTVYADVFAAITAAARVSGFPTTWTYGDARDASGVVPAAGVQAAGAADYAAKTGYSGTNVQVAGIDEGDIVKTDGAYLYIARGRTVAIVSTAGAGSRHVATIDVSGLSTGSEILTGPVTDMMVDGTTLLVLTHGFDADLTGWSQPAATSIGLSASRLKTVFYDIADPTHPVYLTQIEQSGSYVDSRLSDGVLYLVSTYWVNPDGIKESDPTTFVPSVRQGGYTDVLAPGDVCLPPGAGEPAYSLVTATDVARRVVLGEQAVLGAMSTVYLTDSALYLAATQWPYAIAATGATPRTDVPGGGTTDGTATALVKIALNGGKLSLAAQGSVPGTVVNQFALDDRDGYLRLATTWNDTTRGGFQQNSGLWVLDAGLNLVGSIPKLATNEAIQSVRFDGAVGYVVTFRSRDPLFTVDLTDPAKPIVQGALKIPGFSQYLHPFGDGLLLGVGVDATNTGEQTGLKVSLFDVHDPYDVREAATTPVKADSTPVAGDHKAAFVDAEAGLVGFATVSWPTAAAPAGTGTAVVTPTAAYRMYHWSGTQFDEAATMTLPWTNDLAMDGAASVRGVRVGGDFYLVAGGTVGVYDMDGYARLASVTLS